MLLLRSLLLSELIYRGEDVPFIVGYVIFLEERQILLPERFALMMLNLIADVIDHSRQLGTGIGECAESFLS